MSLVPERVMTLTCPPAEAAGLGVIDTTNDAKLTDGVMLGKERSVRLSRDPRLSAPSTANCSPRADCRLIWNVIRWCRAEQWPGENLVGIAGIEAPGTKSTSCA